MKRIYMFALAITSGILMLNTSATVMAQGNSGLAVSPPTFELSGNPGDIVENSLRVDNLTDEAQDLSVDVRNFSALGEEGQVDLTEEDSTYSLASWIMVSPSTSIIPAKGSQTFKYFVRIPANAEPGGRFGSIVFKTAAQQIEGQTGVAVGQEIGTLVFLRVAGNVQEKATIETFTTTRKINEYGPVKFDMRIKNNGSIHIRPTGTVTITDMFGNEVGKVAVDGRNVLPDAIRKMDAEWQSKWLFGKYTATLSLVYGTDNQLITASTAFWGFPYKVMGIILSVFILIGFMLFKGRSRVGKALKALSGKD